MKPNRLEDFIVSVNCSTLQKTDVGAIVYLHLAYYVIPS